MQEERRQLEEKKEAEQKERLERKRLFKEREAKKRATFGKNTNADTPATVYHDVLDKDQASTTIIDDDSTVASTVASTVSGNNNNKRKKPAWCQSETDREAAEIDDEINLLSFVEGLDFDQYTQDLELQSLMGQVKERIKLLEREHKKDETKLQTCLDVSTTSFRSVQCMCVVCTFQATFCCVYFPNFTRVKALLNELKHWNTDQLLTLYPQILKVMKMLM